MGTVFLFNLNMYLFVSGIKIIKIMYRPSIKMSCICKWCNNPLVLACRRYGVVEGRFCFEGGSHCGKGEGLHVLITDQAKELARDFDLASQGRLSPRRRPNNFKNSEGW